MTPQVLFYKTLAAGVPAQITSGPASGKRWIVTTLYICNKGTVTSTISLTHGIPAGTDFSLLNTASHAQGETTSLGSIVMENGQDLDGSAVTSDFDVIGYGYEEDV